MSSDKLGQIPLVIKSANIVSYFLLNERLRCADQYQNLVSASVILVIMIF